MQNRADRKIDKIRTDPNPTAAPKHESTEKIINQFRTGDERFVVLLFFCVDFYNKLVWIKKTIVQVDLAKMRPALLLEAPPPSPGALAPVRHPPPDQSRRPSFPYGLEKLGAETDSCAFSRKSPTSGGAESEKRRPRWKAEGDGSGARKNARGKARKLYEKKQT